MTTPFSRRWALASLCLGLAPLAIADDTEDGADTTEPRLNPLVVTAALAPRTADESLASVTVIDEADLRRQDPVSLPDLLRGQPGVDVQTNGSFGKTSSVYIRGTGNDQSLLMIDGIRLRSATTGGPAWQYLDPRMFQRAEIVRGPRGSLYGAGAVGGVVQLFTPEGEGEPTPRISLGGGSFDTRRASASLSGGEGGTRYHLAASHLDTDGTPVREDGEDKGFDNTTGLVRLSHTFAGGAELGLLGLRARGNTEYDGGDMDFVQQVAGIYGVVPLTEAWSSRLTLSEARDEVDDHQDASSWSAASTSVIETRTRTARWDNTLAFGAHELVVGAEHVEDRVSGTSGHAVDSRHNSAAFAQGLLDFAPVTLQASLRHDDNEAYGEETTGSVALGYDLDARHTLRASYGTAFKAPSFNDLYWPGSGNPDLDPESSQTLELGVRGQYRTWYWDLAAYQTELEDMIAWAPTGSGLWTPQNVDEARIRGVELATGVELDDWTLAGALTYLDPENRESGKDLRRRATQSLRLDIDRELGDWSLGGSWIVQNHRYDDADNQDRLGGFGLLNLRAGWAFAPGWSTRLTLENALDKDYETARDYVNAGRAAFLSVQFGG
ncbi:TonB-dependent receptor domain-containing protein [Halomonas koreensis]|uniref:TonB-dependent receptor n=1 Tax=Halomonas koreensis TaxID=245385 RepID=A0ABU1G420_9GAMM|nr:TonB-dependent receptor [Halomonas koreensis]MDR5867700.1 TonB-dependent receptor [Halomonas koreensis]